MAMSSREIVRRTLEFDHPCRPPRDLWALPVADLQFGPERMRRFRERWPSDFAGPPGNNRALGQLVSGDPYRVGLYRDEWGCCFVNIHAGVIGEVKEPLVSDWSQLDRVRPPVELLEIDEDLVRDYCRQSSQFCSAPCCPRPFERLQFLRGSENLFVDLAEEPPGFFALLDIVHKYNLEELQVWAATEVDCLRFMDDWGSQRGMLISPQQWRRLFKPLYAQYVQIAHDAGKKIFMHSDGWIFDIYGDLIEIGVDAINSQLFCMDIEEIGRRYRGQITFWGEMDRQYILPHGSAAEVEAAVQRVVDALYQPAGGVIAQFELGAAAKLENAEGVFAAWERLTHANAAAPARP